MQLIRPYLDAMLTDNASDLYLTIGYPPSLRVNGNIVKLEAAPLTTADMEALLEDTLNEEQYDEFDSTLELNMALALEDGNRFRVNVFRQMQETGMVIRTIKSHIPTFEELKLPEIYKDFIMAKRGLVLMVGSTGSGKSTSLAVMLEHRNKHGSGHIITIEDPIEYVHQHDKCIFTQREIGMDTYSYGIALKNALRQSPDVMMIGEIRDRETLENAILFCETGHLVIATLHASNANQAIERIINLFPEEMHHQILFTLAQNIKSIVSQRLVEGVNQSHVLAYEILINQGLIKSLIEENSINELKEVMEKNEDQGMLTFDKCLFDLVREGTITAEVALQEADSASNLRLRISQSDVALKFNELDNKD